MSGTDVEDNIATVSWDVTTDKNGKYTITATVEVSGGSVDSGDTITVTPTTGISLGEHVTALDAGSFEVTAP